MSVTLTRFAYTPVGTFGILRVKNGFECYTVEQSPDQGELPTGCIPEGKYKLRKKLNADEITSRTLTQTDSWEVKGVTGRTLILFHPGNTADDVVGCIAPGKRLGFIKNKWAVTDSQAAFDELMAALSGQDEWTLVIDQLKPAL